MGGFHLFDAGAEQHGDRDGVFVVGGADHHGDEDGVAVVHLRDDNYDLIGLVNPADGDLATGVLPSLWSDTRAVDPRNAADATSHHHHRPTPTLPRQGVRVRRRTTGPRRRGREFAPRKNGGHDHLADADPAPLRRSLRRASGREIAPRKKGGDDHLADGGRAPLRQPLRCGREIAPCNCKKGGDDHIGDADPAPVRRPLRAAGRWSPPTPTARRATTTTTTSPTRTRRLYANLACGCGTRTRAVGGGGRVPWKPYSGCISREIWFRPPGPVKHEKSWRDCMGFPMAQTVEDTCSLVACTVCVEAMHRVVYEARHGPGTFLCRAAAPRKLRRACRRDGILTNRGANISDVLGKIRELGGVVTTKAGPPALWVLPLRDWDKHGGGGDGGELSKLTMQRVAQLLDRGPCVATVWAYPWFWLCDADSPDTDFVYGRRCRMSRDFMLLSDLFYGDAVQKHAVVCYAYGICGSPAPKAVKKKKKKDEAAAADEMHVLVMDNQDATGPSRWVEHEELLDMYPVVVDRIEPPLHLGLGGRQITYPRSGC